MFPFNLLERRSAWGDPEEEANRRRSYGTGTPRTYAGYWQLYERSPIARAAVVEVVRTLTSIPFIAEYYDAKSNTYLPLPFNDPYVRLLNDPSATIPARVFYSRFWTHTAVTGNGYIQKRRNRMNELAEWAGPIDARRIRPAGSEAELTGYLFSPTRDIAGSPGLRYGGEDVQTIPARNIIHLPMDVDPADMALGLSPLASALRDLDIDQKITDFIESTLDEGGSVEKAFVTKGKISETEANRIERRWLRRNTGPRGRRFTVINGVEGSLQNVGMSLSAREMGLTDLRKQIEARILMAMDVPPIVVGSVVGLENATYSNYMQARLAFHEENTDPNEWMACSVFEHGLRDEFPQHRGKLMRIRPDLSRVAALLEWEDKRRRLALAEHREGLTTNTESRASVDRPPLANGLGDYIVTPKNMTRIGLDGKPLPDGTEKEEPDENPAPADASTRDALSLALIRGRKGKALSVIGGYAKSLGCPIDELADIESRAFDSAPANGSVRERVNDMLSAAEYETAAVLAERN